MDSIWVVVLCAVCVRNVSATSNIVIDDMKLHVTSKHGVTVNGEMGVHLSSGEAHEGIHIKGEDQVTVTWPGRASLNVRKLDTPGSRDVTCQEVTWEASDCREALFEDCFPYENDNWYGGAAIYDLEWPVQKWSRDYYPFVTGDSIANTGEYGGVMERYWLRAAGAAVYVSWDTPLWVSLNREGDQRLCLRATYEDSPYANPDKEPLAMNYTLCQGADMKQVHMHMVDNFLGKPTDIPDERLFRDPIYSTWARYGADINQSTVLDYAREINDQGFPNAQMEIDDDWETSYGRLDFDVTKFPDPKAMVTELKELGFRTTVWVHPFVDLNSDYVWWGGILFVFMKDPGGLLPALTTWWNGVATTIDYTDPQATDWWLWHLDHLRDEYGVDSFKFDAGEATWLPAAYTPWVPFKTPNEYTRLFVDMALRADPDVRHQEVRVGAGTQYAPMFVRLLDKDSVWGYNNGLKTVIPHVLLFSILGYPFALPDMIGGNAYNGQSPDRELFVRWTQLNVFLPGFQFSIVPWDFDEEVVEICRTMLTLHAEYAPLMIQLAHNSTVTGEPIVRPLWWLAPSDPVAQELDSEFLLGDTVLAAPVVEPGALARNVYLPVGRWRDPVTDVEYDGPLWLNDYPAPLEKLPYFLRV